MILLGSRIKTDYGRRQADDRIELDEENLRRRDRRSWQEDGIGF